MGLPLPWPFERDYMQLALVVGLVIGTCAPLVGAFLVQKQMALMGEGIGHLAFAGVAAGLLLSISPLWTALGVAVVGALLVEWLRGRGKASGDLALALFFYGGIAAGAVFASRAAAEGISVNVMPYLFGSILTVSPEDVWVVAAIGTLIVACTLVAGRALLSVVLDDGAARVAGIPVDGLNALLAILTAVTIVAATRIVGVLLIAALMVLPVASSRLIARSFRTTIVGAAGIGALSTVIGLAAARMWGLAPGGAIVLVATGIFAIVAGITGTTRAGFSLPSHH